MYATSDLMIVVAFLEFLCAQVPYSMKGLVTGTAVLVDFQWSVKFTLRIGILEEQGGVILGMSWPLPSGLASGHWSALLPALAATPL